MFLCFFVLLSITLRVARNCLHSLLVTTCAINHDERGVTYQHKRFDFSSDLTGHVFNLWPSEKKKAILLTCSARQRNYLLFLETKVSSLSLFASCIPTRAHTETHGWFGTAVLPATSSLSFPPLSPWRQASRAGWFQTVVNQHRLKREGEEEGVSLCLNMTKRTLWALCYLSPHTEVIKVSGHSRKQADVQKEVFW